MSALEPQGCPECKSALVDDAQNGETVCSSCGIVISEQLEDRGPEPTGGGTDGVARLARATGMTTYAQHDLGITTDIAASRTDFSGKRINPAVNGQMNNLRKWQQRIRVSTPRERRLANVLAKIGEICQGSMLPRNILETASVIYRNLDARVDVKGRSVASMSVAAVYMACKRCGVVRSIDEICGNACPARNVKATSKLAAKYYRTMVMEMGAEPAPVITMDKHISRIANVTKTDARIERLALEIAAKTGGGTLGDGKAPSGMAAAYLYVSSVLLGQNVPQRDVSATAGVTEVTIRARCRDILESSKFKITLKPSLRRDDQD
ncbi:transcription initiation factor TFIIB [Cenarchaeum symbiosum A]|uniref:Transcription initiation factor TFIIB n=1 Tax=Cenarchaeum symbiosum (strain A) TaxID=414004 RepID=A0RXG8_CENSY|nr:transcription initiation factor TFIIB [Cenarchaeum symbiosum A]